MQTVSWIQTFCKALQKEHVEEGGENLTGDQWTLVQKANPLKKNSRIKGKGVPLGKYTPNIEKFQGEGSRVPFKNKSF
jgi:hypothetical protein